MNTETSHHIVSTKKYLTIFLSLFVLTGVTVYTAKYVDLGDFNLALAMVIAFVKGLLVILFFMGLYWDKEKISSYAFAFSVMFFALFVALCMIDIVGRDTVSPDDVIFSDGYAPRVEGLTGSTSDRENFMKIDELLELRRQIIMGETPNLNLTK